MQFDFSRLIAHAARTRPLAAGTIVGSGTVSNEDRTVGSSCLAEVRTIEAIGQGKAATGFLRFGDRVRIEMADGRHRHQSTKWPRRTAVSPDARRREGMIRMQSS